MLSRSRSALGNAMLRSVGWTTVGRKPSIPKYVVIAAPHTSNWDLVLTLACAAALETNIKWVGKHTLFEGPRGKLLHRLGGIPVERHHRTNFVDQMAALFEERDSLALLVASEGTRSRVDFWKSGFYHIARTANVPIVLGFLDYKRKECGFGPAILPTGDIGHDMDQIRAFYSEKVGLYPKNFGPIRLRSEMENESSNEAKPST